MKTNLLNGGFSAKDAIYINKKLIAYKQQVRLLY